MYALDHRQQLSGRWGFMLFSGLIDLILAAMILIGLPGTAAWAIGLLVGINMIFGGFGAHCHGPARAQQLDLTHSVLRPACGQPATP